ncbi:Flp pilus assembly protein TadG [Limimaricola soesokkakensis]|uniref:Flp pilus assembly protein TadG n=1 Tax=Limimaricola soesokkakensis TaxID=1343159 RepID=A0A1X7A1E2_9RHOB|nr:TadE/TadG family type IV pilus assembly protein [Limimaricola soesokkakensis]PSK81568.1 Flp pilus assembly protein TadG [Limimaricola soesokkakensis]SLN67322.1 von Willebrand factor type A domain protein [Limimaricola soesokkakensis]
MITQKFKTACRRFCRDESGAIMALSLFLFLAMIAIGGLGVDVANYERNRTLLQTHLDNAVLAAASLTQELDPKEVVRSYLVAAGAGDLAPDVEVKTEQVGGLTVGRTVTASVDGALNTFFLKMFGYSELGLHVVAQATERVEDIEISLVLDVSGSMGLDAYGRTDYRKINQLKTAAKDFVTDVLSEAEPNRVSISLVPYSTKVNAGAALLGGYKTTNEHGYSHCVDFNASDFLRSGIDPTWTLQRTGHFQFQGADLDDPTKGQWTCRIDNGFEITPLSQSISVLHNRIDALSPEGSTSIDMGVKWGLALLDPSAQAPVRRLIGQGRVDGAFQGRPRSYDTPESVKVLVIMTDGKNDTEYRLNPGYASGNSIVRRYGPYRGQGPWYASYTPENYYANDGWGWSSDGLENWFFPQHPREGSRVWDDALAARGYSEKLLTWPEVWAEMSPHWYAYNLRAKRYNSSGYWSSVYSSTWNEIHSTVGNSEKNQRLERICGVAKTMGVVTFSIGFEVAPGSDSLALLQNCAYTPAHYFNVDGLQIETAFDMIASSISMLRLTR